MSTVPKKISDRLAWYALRAPVWGLNAAQIGLEPTAATAFSEEVGDVQLKYQALQAARAAARAREVEFKSAYAAMSDRGGNFVRTIRAFAQTTALDQVYATAQIPPPKIPAPLPAPGKPYDAEVQLRAGGSLGLSWKCLNPADGAGVRYEIRRTDGSGATVLLGSVGERRFTDTTLPAGSASVTYTITAVRSDKQGLANQFLVQFGTGGAGAAGGSLPMIRKAA